jgi:ribonuclease Z
MPGVKKIATMKIKLIIVILLLFGQLGYAQEIKITLLGTGTPQPSIERFGPSTLVEANGQYFLFDCGRGASQRLWQQKIPLGKINNVFFTHLHSDHLVGFPDLWLTGWLPANFGRRNVPMEVWGPKGIDQMTQGLQSAYAWDIQTRVKGKHEIDSAILITTHTIKEGVIYDKDGVQVIAFLVDHADFIDNAFGFRLNFKGHSVVISGDTRYNENLIKNSKGVDVLIHEVALAHPELIKKSEVARQIQSFHTTPEEAGKIFSTVNPRLAIYSHIALILTDPTIPPANINDLIPRTKAFYNGKIEIGEDLMVVEVGKEITVKWTN